jgi:hypothetical protein
LQNVTVEQGEYRRLRTAKVDEMVSSPLLIGVGCAKMEIQSTIETKAEETMYGLSVEGRQ